MLFIFSKVKTYIIKSIVATILVIIGYQLLVNLIYFCIITALTVIIIFRIAIKIQ
jgi:hypothetical protein